MITFSRLGKLSVDFWYGNIFIRERYELENLHRDANLLIQTCVQYFSSTDTIVYSSSNAFFLIICIFEPEFMKGESLKSNPLFVFEIQTFLHQNEFNRNT